MKINPIPKFQRGNSIWYNGIRDFNPLNYTSAYDTSKLVNPLNYRDAWTSRTNGYGRGRYVPNPNFNSDYIKDRVENNKYYQDFTKALFNSNGTLSDVGKAYAKLSDNLLPENSLARVYNGDLMRNNWTTTNNDTLGRPGKSFNNVKNYLWYERNDNLPGGRHNVFLKKGKRYFYVDNEGNYHWVSPEEASNYLISEKPVEYGWGENDGVYWEDYELTGPKNPNGAPSKTTTGSYGTGVKQNPDAESKLTFWQLLQSKLKTQGPNILEALRLGINLHNNARVYDTMMLSIKPALLLTYLTHRQIVGDEATKQAYYKRGAEGVTRASRAFTSDADRQMAYLMESNRAANELQAQGDLADNQEIRRTSDESNAHSWGNTERRTQVYNLNHITMLDALAKKANLTALKFSADTTDWDNYLMGVQSRAERERLKEEALNDLIFGLWAQDALVNDAEYNAAVTNLQNVIKKHEDAGETDYWNAQDVRDAIQARSKALRRAMIRIYRDRLNFDYNNIYVAKSGRKLTLKDDLLYKTAKDVVEHFRKMVRMLDSSRIRSRLKPIKLSSHPKKFLQGGVAPFTIFRPLAMGGENTVSTLTGGGNTTSKKSEGKELLDMIKELFKLVEGLPIDVNTLYRDMNNFLKRYEAFGLELTTEDIASMYLSSMAKLSQLKYSLSVFNQAKELATKNEALNELAITRGGKLVLQDKSTGELKEGTMNEWYESDGKLTALTNDLLLNLRALSKDLAFNDNILNIVNNGVGINKVTAQIKALASQIGSSEQEIEGFGKVESGKIKAGLKLLENAPDGVYKINQYSKDLQQLAKLAIEYIYNMLPNNYKVLLEYHSKGRGKDMVAAAIGSTLDYSTRTTVSPLTGKAAKDDSESDRVDGKINSSFADQLLRDLIGIPRKFSLITKDGNTELYSLNSKYISQLPNVTSDMSLDLMLASSNIGTIMDSRYGVTFGDLIIDPSNFKDIMFDLGGGATIVTLPCKIINGHKVVNLAVKDEYDEAIKEVSKDIPVNYQNPLFVLALASKLHEKGLDSLLSGNNLNPDMFGHFIVVSAYTSDKVKFDTNSRYVEKVKNPNEDLENRIISALSNNKDKDNYELDIDNHWGFLEGFWDDIYRGSIFIPINNDPVSAQMGNSTIKLNEVRGLAEDYQNYQKINNLRSSSSDVL